MREVSVRMVHLVIDLARAGGVDEHALTAGLTSMAVRNDEEPDWVDWDDFVEAVERLERMLGGPAAFGRAARAAASIAYPDVRALAAIFGLPIPLFKFVMRRLVRTFFRHVEFGDPERVGEHSVRWRQTIPEPYRPSEAFHRETIAQVEIFPTHLGLSEATVEVLSLEARSAQFVVTFPPPAPLGVRGARAMSAATAAMTAHLDRTYARIADNMRAQPRPGEDSTGGASLNARPKVPVLSWATTLALSPRQRDVFALLVEGRANKDIAGVLSCSERNVEFHVGRILRAARVTSRSELLVKVLGSRV